MFWQIQKKISAPGKWESDTDLKATCKKDKVEILEYCKKVSDHGGDHGDDHGSDDDDEENGDRVMQEGQWWFWCKAEVIFTCCCKYSRTYFDVPCEWIDNFKNASNI